MRGAWLALGFAAVLLAAGCSPSAPSFRSTDITGASFGRELALKDHAGRPRSLADFRGKAVVVFFGFTHCPDVCPTALSTIKEAVERLGADKGRVQVLFVTVDPERDTPDLLSRYVTAFDPSFIGLYGSAEEIARAAREFKVFYQKVPGKTPESYTVDHSTGMFVFDPQGRLRLFAAHGQGAEALAHDLGMLLRATG
jgi:protein SCO1/2